jgi:polyhydroxyalkanoate synthesis regulator phasin
MFAMTKLAAGVAAGVLSFAVTGAAAYAAFQPVEGAPTAASIPGQASEAQAERGGKGELAALNAILERFVQNGTITAEQKAKILEALRTAGQRDERHLKEIWEGLMGLSVEYLGLTKDQVGEALRAGTSLSALANETSGKSRQGLIDLLVERVTARVDQAVADEKVTPEQADRFTAGLAERIAKFVDHVYEKKQPKDRDKERKKDQSKERNKDRDKEQAKPVKVQAFLGDLMKAAALYFDIERGEIVRQLAQGKSLGEIAGGTEGKSRDGLVDALTESANENVDAVVAKGRITVAQGATAKEHVAEAVEKFVDAKKHGRTKPGA